MILTTLIALGLGAFVAYANGSNDVSKSIATLAGSGVTNYRRAILWGTAWTGVGGLAGAFLARAMITTFGKGLLAHGVVASPAAAIATILGAAGWVAISTRTGWPVSTTHAIVGAIAGVGSVAYGAGGVNWHGMGGKILLPLLISPVAALGVTSIVLRGWELLSKRYGAQADCICAQIEASPAWATLGPESVALVASGAPGLRLTVNSEAACAVEHPKAVRVTVNHLHGITSGATAFARGMNDGPKMVALVLAAGVLSGTSTKLGPAAFVVITLGMVAGSWVAGRRVTTVLAEKVTRMDHRQGFVANLVTAALVGPGAALGLPMSTTHVSSGAIIGIGVKNKGTLNWKTLREMLVAWVVTLPGAAVLGIAVYGLLRLTHLG